MKFFACLFALVAVACIASADNTENKKEGLLGSSYGAPAQSYGAPAPSYGGAAPSYSAPPCPKNYLFSCQPNLAPVPCASSHGGYSSGSMGAYSEQIPRYAVPQWAGVPQW